MVGTVKYTQEFVDQYGNRRWIGVELQYDMNMRTPAEMFLEAEAAVKAHGNYYLEPTKTEQAPIPTVQVNKTTGAVDLYHQMSECNTLEEIDSFKRLVDLSHNENLLAAFKIKRKAIVDAEKQAIIGRTEDEIKK